MLMKVVRFVIAAAIFCLTPEVALASGVDVLAVLYGDPAAGAAAFADVKYTVRAGKVIYEALGRPVR